METHQQESEARGQIYTTEIVTDASAFERLGPEWDALLDASGQQVFFLRWHWSWLWWQHFAPKGAELHLLCCRNEHGQLVGVAPFYRRQHCFLRLPIARELVMLGTGIELKTSEYLDVFARRNEESAVAESMASALRSQPHWDRVWLRSVPIDSTVIPRLVKSLDSRASSVVCDQAQYIDTSEGWEQYKRGLGRSMRRNCEYYKRRLFKQHDCEFRQVRCLDELEEAFGHLVRLHQARWRGAGEPGVFSYPKVEKFLRETMRQGFTDGRLRLWTLRVGTDVEAALVGFLDKGVLHYFQKGFNPAFAKDDIGTVILSLCIRACCDDEEITAFDFMGGGAPYKAMWARRERITVLHEVSRSNLRVLGHDLQQWGRAMAGDAYRLLAPSRLQHLRRAWLRRRRFNQTIERLQQVLVTTAASEMVQLMSALAGPA